MLKGLIKKGLALVVAALTLVCVGFALPALADDVAYSPDDAMLTKVIDAPEGTDASGDRYVFHFAGGGEVTEQGDNLYSDGVEQNATTLKIGDIVPVIGDVTLNGVVLGSDNTLSNGQTAQTVVQKSISEILSEQNIVFPHAGVYTYVVTERAATTALTDGTYINASQAEYILRIDVVNSDTGLAVAGVTVEQVKDDNGDDAPGKIDPTYPKAPNGKITETAAGVSPAANTLAGDARGRNLDGFTFANEYIKGGSFVVEKLYDGDHSDKTNYSMVELAVYSSAAASADAQGACLTYVIDGDGIDRTDNLDAYGEHTELNGVVGISQANDYMVEFNADGWAYIKADLKEGSYIRITGVFGRFNPDYADEAPNGQDKRMTVSTSGLVNGMTYYVIERHPGDYLPTGYVYVGENATVDPRDDASGMTKVDKLTESQVFPGDQTTVEAGSLYVEGTATGSATTVFVVNTIDESKVSPTGILIENLPYILMVGGPLAIFAGVFVYKRRKSTAA